VGGRFLFAIRRRASDVARDVIAAR